MINALEDSILTSLRKITRAIDLHSRQLAKEYKLTGPQVVCLRRLRATGTTLPSILSREVSLSQATITGILDRLEAQGLVERQRDRDDRRRVNISLTSQGIAIAESSPEPLQDRFLESLNQLPKENQQIIDTVLRQVVDMMEAKQLEAAPVLQAGSIIDGPTEPA
jgi:DNA-binding MarR family transcriptional regulator